MLYISKNYYGITGGNFKSDYRPVGVIAFTWCLFAFFIVNIYSSCVTSYTSLKFQRPDVQTFQDVASDSRYQVLTVESSFPDRMFKVRQIILWCFSHIKLGKITTIMNSKLYLGRWKRLVTNGFTVLRNAALRTLLKTPTRSLGVNTSLFW